MKRWLELKGRERRHKIIRKHIAGTKERPRLSVYRSQKHMYAQLIDDASGSTILSLSTGSLGVKEKVNKDSSNVKGALLLGGALADICKKKNITKIVLDRSGYLYHGRVKALAEALRKGGLEF